MWSRNDKAFLEKYETQSWEKYIEDFNKTPSIDVKCLAEGNENCNRPIPPNNWHDNIIYLDQEYACVFNNNRFDCIQGTRNAACLKIFSDFKNTIIEINSSDTENYNVEFHDRHEICSRFLDSVVPVGKFIKLNRNINVRKTPAGILETISRKGNIYQVLDYEIRDSKNHNRYYLIKHNNKTGYIYSGNSFNSSNWAEESKSPPGLKQVQILIPIIDDYVKIIAPWGINLRANPNEEVLTRIPSGQLVQITNLTIREDINKIYLKVNYNGYQGFIYSGSILPLSTINGWVLRK